MLGFLVCAWIGLVVILIVAPDVYDRQLKLPPGQRVLGEVAFLATLSCFLAVLAVGIVRRWRWTFWLLLVANFAGVLRFVASSLEMAGVVPSDEPTWYVLFQATIGLVQFALGVLMLLEYRRAGTWGRSKHRA